MAHQRSVKSVGDRFIYERDTELRRVPVVMDTPTVFAWKETRRAVYKQSDIAIKIDYRRPGYLYPFDRYVVEFSFVVVDKDQEPLSPTLWCELSDPRFVHSTAKPLVTPSNHGERAVVVPESLFVALLRPTYQKIFFGLTLLMSLASVVWSLYKIMYTTVEAMESLSLLAFNVTILRFYDSTILRFYWRCRGCGACSCRRTFSSPRYSTFSWCLPGPWGCCR